MKRKAAEIVYGNHFIWSGSYKNDLVSKIDLQYTGEPDIYLKPDDGSIWKANDTYHHDGHGNHLAFYRLPLPDFDELVDLLLNSDIQMDKSGAALVLVNEEYADRLLVKCLEIIDGDDDLESYSGFFAALKLEKKEGVNPNRSPVMGKRYSQVKEDHENWERVENVATDVLAAKRDALNKAPKKKGIMARISSRFFKGSN